MTENQVSNEIRAALNSGKTRCFRNHTGKVQCKRTGHWHAFGLPSSGGGSDLIGCHSMTITPEHVGKRIAVFVAIECKSPTGKPTAEQTAFIEFIAAMGGIAAVARSADEALAIIQNYKPCP